MKTKENKSKTKCTNGVKPEYDIRTDKWQIAINAMDRVNAYKLSDYTKNGRNPEMKETEKSCKES